jgi:ABC-type dipeptide/oligopeptide/nickel transport system permease component
MGRYAARRLALLIPTLLGITLAVFALRALIPGDPVELMFFGQNIDQATIDKVRHQLGLDRPLPIQYLHFVTGAARGDFGTSIQTGLPVAQEIKTRYPNTLLLAAAATSVAIVLGVTAGVLSAVARGGMADTLIMAASSIGQSMPSFWLGLLLISVFGVWLRWLPVMGTGGGLYLVLPAATIGLISSALIARIARSDLLEVLGEDYVRTARSKGLGEARVITRHALRNAGLSVITIIGLQFGNLLAGAFIVEVVFSWNGVGQLAVNAINQRDFPVIQGVLLVVATTYVLVNTGIDFVYALLDPRISYA